MLSFQLPVRPDEVHSSGWKLVFNYNQCTVPEITTILQIYTYSFEHLHTIWLKSIVNHLDERSKYDWTVSLCGLVVRVFAQNARGVQFDPHQGLYTFQSYCVEMFKRVNVNLFLIKCFVEMIGYTYINQKMAK